MATDVMIQASNLSKRFGNVRALDKVSFEVEKGEVVGFLGPNGAGKSTTMRILTCFLAPTSGTAKVHGTDVFDDPLEVRRNLGYLPQRAPLYTDMVVRDYLKFVAEIRGLSASQFRKSLDSIIEVCGLAQVLEKDIGTLSHGYRQRVGLGQALLHDPQILILDEPTADLDPNEKAEVIRYIKDIGKDRTVLLSTHNLAEVEEACARAIIVSKGKVVADGPLEDIRAKTGSVRYVVSVDETNALSGSAPKAAELISALESIKGVIRSRELPTDETAFRIELAGEKDSDLRAEIFRLMVDKAWLMLELRRDAQSLDAVFRDLTRADEALDRGLAAEDDVDDEDDEEQDDDSDESEDDSFEDEGDEDSEDDDEEEEKK
jgi:ABC-2 type transport system ATP-binding protein